MLITRSGFILNDETPADGTSGVMFQLSDQTSRYERVLQTSEYDFLDDITKDLLGYSFIANGPSSAKYIARYLPEFHPEFLDVTGAYPILWASAVQRGEGRGMDPSGSTLTGFNTPKYQRAILRLAYTSRPYRILPDGDAAMRFVPDAGQPNPLLGLPDEASMARYVSVHLKAFSRFITIPRVLMRWTLEAGDTDPAITGGGGPTMFEGLSVSEPGFSLEIIHHRRPDIPLTRMGNLIGTINKYALRTPRGTFPAKTCLLQTPDVVSYTDVATGEIIHDIHFRWTVMFRKSRTGSTIYGHNAALRFIERDAGKPIIDYRYVTSNGKTDGDYTYKEADHADLFRPE